jgi:hypothetical protein
VIAVFYITAVFVAAAAGMLVLSVRKIEDVHGKTKGVIRSRRDLVLVKGAIDLSMRLAIIYICLFILFIVLLVVSVARGTSLGQAGAGLFVFGIVTLPTGLVGKKYEKKIKSMKVESDDPDLETLFESYLLQWGKPKFQLTD